jgi:branched-chain amino acid transport system permease protein
MTLSRTSLLGSIGIMLVLPLLTQSSYFHHLLVLWMLFALLALSLNIIVGYLGELSFGHAAFFGIGAYAAAILTMEYGFPAILALLAAGLIAGLFGVVIGYVALRIEGPQFAILTLGFGSIIYTVTTYWVDLTRGPMGISNIPYFSFGFGTPAFESARANYYLALGFVLVAGYACHALVASRTGRAFIALRENAPLAASLGVDTFHMKLLGFVAATALAGIGGALYAHYIRVITPELMSLNYMAALVIMVIVGGRGTIVGPVLGALVYVGLLELLRATGAMRLMIFAALLTLSVIFLPGGLVSLGRRLLQMRSSRRAEDA